MSVSCKPGGRGAGDGLVTRAQSNLCEVLWRDGTIVCKLRGRLKLDGTNVLTGDRVTVEALDEGRGLITGVLPRRSVLVRPPVANVDLCVIVFTPKSPPINLELVDRLLVVGQSLHLDLVLCLNKIDLATPAELETIRAAYAGAGWPLIEISAKQGVNVDQLVANFQDKVAVLAGQSGVGKSTLLNTIAPDLDLAVGELSAKVQRGRHTTRSVRLLRVGGGWVADTPGFVRLDLPAIEPRELAGYYQEMVPYLGACQYRGCLHDPEPNCAVKAGVQAGEIDEGRYRRYLDFLHELQARPRY